MLRHVCKKIASWYTIRSSSECLLGLLFFHPSHVPGAFLYQKHEQYTSILKLNRKGVFLGQRKVTVIALRCSIIVVY